MTGYKAYHSRFASLTAKTMIRHLIPGLLAMLPLAASAAAPVACTGGVAAGFPCAAVDLLSHADARSATASGADIWGFIDLNTGREYAVMGYSSGTAVYDVTDPANPQEVGFVGGQSTSWRDMKIYQYWDGSAGRFNAYAYVSSDATTEGLFVIDLTGLPHTVSRVSYSGDFSEAHNVLLTNTEFTTGLSLLESAPLLIVAGSDRADGRFRAYSLANPRSPAFVASPATPATQPAGNSLYVHDTASILVTDSRKDTQCVNAAMLGACNVLFDFNESEVDIWDISDVAAPVRLSSTNYANRGYTHSGWSSEDGLYLFVQDELDERNFGMNTTLRVFSVADLAAPVLVGTWSGPTRAIDHNGFSRGNRYYMSNYARGLTILDISTPATPVDAGYFDTYPASNATGFPGAWGVYPYFASGALAVSDIDSGLYMLADRTLAVPEGTLSFSQRAFGAVEGGTAVVSVSRAGGASGSISVDWELVAASAALSDVAAGRGTLSWPDGDSGARTISIDLVDDGTAEDVERLVIRLTNPAGGATLSAPAIATVSISDPGAQGSVAFLQSAIGARETGFATAVAVVARSGSASGLASVDFAIDGGTATAGTDFSGPASGTLTWADGDADPKSIEYAIIDDGAGENDEFFDIVLSNATGASLGASDTLRVTIDGTAPPPPPPPSSGGGGAPAPIALGLLLGVLVLRRVSRRDDA